MAINGLELITLQEYFNKNVVIKIPQWQREYSWKATESGQAGILLADLKDFVESENTEYLIGPVILCKENDHNNANLLIDGQQRTLTFLIFLMAARKFIKTQNYIANDGEPYHNVIFNIKKCISLVEGEYSARVQMSQNNADSILEELFNWSGSSDGVGEAAIYSGEFQTPTQKNLANVAKYFYNDTFKKNKWVPDSKESFLGAMDKILNGVKFIEIVVTKQSEAIEIYDRINDRGMPLTSADLVKNRMFQKVTQDEYENISGSWFSMVKTLNQCDSISLNDPKFLLRALAMGESGKKITQSKLTEYYSDKIESNSINPILLANSFAENANNLLIFSESKNPMTNKIAPELLFSNNLNSVQQYPLLLACGDIMNAKVKELVINQISKRTAFYTLSGERTQEFESLVPIWAHKIKEAGSSITIEDAKSIYDSTAKISIDGFARLELLLRELRYTSSGDKTKMRTILGRISWIIDKNVNSTTFNPVEYFTKNPSSKKEMSWDLEHIQPQSKASKIDVKYLHSLGNFVLLSPRDNRSAQDKSPDLKLKHYNDSVLYLTKSLIPIGDLPQNVSLLLSKYFSKIGHTPDWDLNSWEKQSILSRMDLYIKILKYDLENFDS
jgi:uncharacterized protein with ParB-like and HNH nuclease domain